MNTPIICRPKVNINGSSCRELVNQRLEVLRLLDSTAVALAKIAPHGRDYQLNDVQDFGNDRITHSLRMKAIGDLYKAIEAEAFFIQNQEA